MNYAQLQAWIIDDSHREDYAGTIVQNCIQEAEDRIFARLESYTLVTALTDAQRVGTTGEYNIAGKIIKVRYVIPDGGIPLDEVDELGIAQYASLQSQVVWTPRPTSIVIAGTPGTGWTGKVHYFGLPDRLSVTNTNTLLDDCMALYKKMAQVSVFQRMHDYESAQVAFQEGNSLIDELNRQMKKKLGGRRSSPPYNVGFRSSY